MNGRHILLLLVILLHHVARAQTVSKYIVVDQFGYRPDAIKMAIIRDPQVGFDQAESFEPGTSYAVVNAGTQEQVFAATLSNWNAGATDAYSGDKVKWFDFTSVKTPGKYYVLDVQKNLKSFEFEIREDVYEEVLRHSVRAFFYQRAGIAKDAAHAGAAWADGASHIKNLQDKNARVYNKMSDASTERDVSGGWYDAGDYNKYTSWTASYVIGFMYAYVQNPQVWRDDYNLPESGNGVPDILDEAKWGIDHLLRMQQSDGSVLSIVGLSHASPPSSATGPSAYGTPSTAATLNTAAAFAFAAKVFASVGQTTYANTLKEQAIAAWTWAKNNPAVIFRNNDSAAGTAGLGSGQQEVDDYGRFCAKMQAACFLFDVTGEEEYRTYFESHYNEVHMIAWGYVFPFEQSNQDMLLYYSATTGATASIADDIRAKYKSAMNSSENFGSYTTSTDPYRAYIKDYTWGSNLTKATQGQIFMNAILYHIDETKNDIASQAAEGYVNYIHGVNPLNLVYLSNMYRYGGDNCVNEFYHSWFANGSGKWDRVGVSTYGPAPGYLVGGPNPSYNWDSCCPSGCGGTNNSLCTAESITPPKGQPALKSFKDFNTSWPLNSWTVTENSNGYQIGYIRLLSHFVKADGPDVVTGIDAETLTDIQLYPNPSTGIVSITGRGNWTRIRVTNALGVTVNQFDGNITTLNLGQLPPGVYTVIFDHHGGYSARKLIRL